MYMLLKLFIAMFINTAISTLMAYFSFVSDNMSIQAKGARYSDFDRE